MWVADGLHGAAAGGGHMRKGVCREVWKWGWCRSSAWLDRVYCPSWWRGVQSLMPSFSSTVLGVYSQDPEVIFRWRTLCSLPCWVRAILTQAQQMPPATPKTGWGLMPWGSGLAVFGGHVAGPAGKQSLPLCVGVQTSMSLSTEQMARRRTMWLPASSADLASPAPHQQVSV